MHSQLVEPDPKEIMKADNVTRFKNGLDKFMEDR